LALLGKSTRRYNVFNRMEYQHYTFLKLKRLFPEECSIMAHERLYTIVRYISM